MKKYLIKWVSDDGTAIIADKNVYEGENELDALHHFTEARRNDLTITNVEVVNDDPDDYIVWIEGYVENQIEERFDIVGDEFQYIAVEVNE